MAILAVGSIAFDTIQTPRGKKERVLGGKRKELAETLKGIDVLLINDGEAKLLAEHSSLPKAANKILTMGPKAVVIKHGEYGATLFFKDGAFGLEGGHPFRAPALPIGE